jgi:NAD-dependent SIR2 family protein deacetylase
MAAAEGLFEFMDRHRQLLVLTGAGCSAPSGIPDYRDAAGAWKHTKPMTLAEFTGSAAARRRYWAGSLRGWPRVRDARPNPAHHALAALETRGRVTRLVTQNVDGLHQRAGSRAVVDLHGRLDRVECLDCGSQVSRDDVQTLLLAWNPQFTEPASPTPVTEEAAGVDGEISDGSARPDGDSHVAARPDELRVPACRDCGGVLKPHVVFFGENVPRPRVQEAMAALDDADAVLVVGSSLMVFSGYRFVLAARERGRPVALVNLGQTRADGCVSLKVNDDCAVVLPTLVA